MDDERALLHATTRASHAALDPAMVELDVTDLSVRGALPAGLDGTLVVVGPDTDDLSGWGMGVGVLHALQFADRRASLRSRRVVPASTEDPDSYAGRVGLRAGRGNSNLVHHAGRLLALHEVGLPIELDASLGTVGLYDFDGRLTTAMCAHPKVDAASGELIFYGTAVTEPYLTAHVADASGTLRTSVTVALDGPTSMHDVAVSERWIAFIDQPNVVSFPHLVVGRVVYDWDPAHPARLALLDRAAPTSPVRRIDMPARDVTHVLNAFDDGGTLVIDVVARTPTDDGGTVELFPTLRRWTVDTATGAFDERSISTIGVENPKVDDRVMTRRHRQAYAIEVGGEPGGPGNFMSTMGWVRIDTETGEVSRYHLGPGFQLGQAVFVPRPGSADDQDGWVVGCCYDHRAGTGAALVLDAGDLAAGPIATVELPRPVPASLDAIWLDASVWPVAT